MFKFSKRHYGFILLLLMLTVKGIKFDDFCMDIVDKFILGGIGLLFFMVFLIVIFYNLYHISLKKEFFDFVSFIFLAVFTVVFYISFKSPGFEVFKTNFKTYESIKRDTKKVELQLFTDNSFLVVSKLENTKCYCKGKYFIQKNKLIISDFDKDKLPISSTLKIDEINGFLLPKDTLRLKREIDIVP